MYKFLFLKIYQLLYYSHHWRLFSIAIFPMAGSIISLLAHPIIGSFSSRIFVKFLVGKIYFIKPNLPKWCEAIISWSIQKKRNFLLNAGICVFLTQYSKLLSSAHHQLNDESSVPVLFVEFVIGNKIKRISS